MRRFATICRVSEGWVERFGSICHAFGGWTGGFLTTEITEATEGEAAEGGREWRRTGEETERLRDEVGGRGERWNDLERYGTFFGSLCARTGLTVKITKGAGFMNVEKTMDGSPGN